MVIIIDYGMGNTGSVKNALEALGAETTISNSPADLARASHIILPGVGAFPDGMKNLKASGILPFLEREVLRNKKPFLGICLGMQMLASYGEEGEGADGLGWIPGRVRRFEVDENAFRVPHVGWNDADVKEAGRALFEGVVKPAFYFTHSYHLVPDDMGVIAATADHGECFAAAVRKGNIFGVQFHPEKSQFSGLKLFQNFLSYK